MAEWFKAAVLKTVDGETRPGVRIPLPPPLISLAAPLSAGTQRIRYEEDNRAANRRDPKEEHVEASIKFDGTFYMPIFWLFRALDKE